MSEPDKIIKLEGNWSVGFAYEIHTVSSKCLGLNEFGHMTFDNEYSEMGRLVHDLKYRYEIKTIPKIIELLRVFKNIQKRFDCVVPIPATQATRPFQPVTEIAKALAKDRGLPAITGCLAKKQGTQQLKNVNDPNERLRILRESMYVADANAVAGKSVLVVDDLFRGGATFQVATELLLSAGRAKDVSVLAMTKTRATR